MNGASQHVDTSGNNLKCNVNKLFDALTRADQFGELTGAPAQIAAEDGGKFSCFGPMVLGVTVELVAGERIVQAWHIANWEPGDYSIVRFELEATTEDECKLVLDHLASPSQASELGLSMDDGRYRRLLLE
jgi:activator of HSP90 ATPase